MSNPIFVLNASSLQLSRLVEKATKGLGDLLPGEVGKIPADVAKQPRVQAWIEAKRLTVITEEEFLKSFEKKDEAPAQKEQTQTKTENVTFKAKHHVQKTTDGTTIIVPGLEQLPEIDSIPEPDVSNLEGFIAIKAPRNDEPLTERAGDPVEVKKEDLQISLLKPDGTVEKAIPSTEKVEEKTEEKVEEKTPDTVVSASTEEKTPTPFLSAPATESIEPSTETGTEASSAVTPVQAESESILNMRAWKQQVKAVKNCSSPEVLLAVAEKTTYDKVKEACAERLSQVSG